MPWLRAGDNAASYPPVMALATAYGSDDRLTNEVFGFVVRCALQSAAHMTDYRIDLGVAQMLGGTRTEKLLKAAVEVGLLTSTGRGRQRVFILVDDKEFLHIRLKADVLWTRQRDMDRRNKKLTVPVRYRDGDQCRYCGRVVTWGDNRSGVGGTYDHRVPGEAAASPDDLYVACRQCNGRRGDDPDADERLPRLPAPSDPYYTHKTIVMLRNNGLTVTARPEPPGSDTAAPARPHRDSAASARPKLTGLDTAAPAREPSTDGSTAAPRDLDETPPLARPEPPGSGTAASRPARSGGHAPDTAHPFDRGKTRPPDWAVDPPGGNDATVPVPRKDSQSEDWHPGRVGSGRDGPGAAPVSAGVAAHPPNPSSADHSHQRRTRGRRGSRSKGRP